MPSDVDHRHRSATSTSSVPLGTARWTTPDEALGRFRFDDRLFSLNGSGLWVGRSNGQVWIGETTDQRSNALGYRDDRHICLVSAIRGGKGTSAIIPNLCLWPGSCIVVDPKGENATITANRRGAGSAYAYGMGQTVRILDPFGEVQLDSTLKARFNPLDAIDPASDFAVDDAGRIAAALVVVESQSDPFWEEAARDLIKALILHVLTSPEFHGQRNLVSVWRLVNQGDWISVDTLRAAGDSEIPSGFALLWQAMKSNHSYNGLIAGTGEQLLSMADRTRSSVLGTAKTNLEFLSGPPMQRLLEASDFDLAALKTDPNGLTLYLTLPQRYMATHFRWLRLMISLAIGEMERVKGRPATGHPTLFLLDEFAGLKRMEVIENATAQAAGFGVKFFFVVQSLVQLKEIYKDSWEVFLGNSGLQLYFQIADDFTRSYLSRQIGEHEVRRQSQSGSQSQSDSESVTDGWSTTSGQNTGTTTSFLKFSRSYNRGSSESTSNSGSRSWSRSTSRTGGWSDAVHKRSLINPDEIGRLLARVDDRSHPAYPGILVALVQGEHPLLARRVNYFESFRFAGYFDPHSDFPPPPTLAMLEEQAVPKQQPSSKQRLPPWKVRWILFLNFIRRGARPSPFPRAADIRRLQMKYRWLSVRYKLYELPMAVFERCIPLLRIFVPAAFLDRLVREQRTRYAIKHEALNEEYFALNKLYGAYNDEYKIYNEKLEKENALSRAASRWHCGKY
jgi:type IV secretory pathway TraG/TraD family ATPase VirD4